MSPQISDNNKRIAKNTLLPYALYDGGVVVYEPCHIKAYTIPSMSRREGSSWYSSLAQAIRI